MKYRIAYIILMLVGATAVGCKKAPTTAEMTITCVPLSGVTVNVSDLKAELHATATYDNLKYHFQVKGTQVSSKGTLKEIEPGRYFLVVWKDMDSNSKFSKDDIFGFHPAPLNLKAGDIENLTIQMYIVE